MQKQQVIYRDLGTMEYQQAWDLQELLLQENLQIKSAARILQSTQNVCLGTGNDRGDFNTGNNTHVDDFSVQTVNYLLFVEHPPVYTLGKSGRMENLLISEQERLARGIRFFKINRGGDITFHGPGQVVGYPILDLEKFYTDIGKYLRNMEEIIIRTLADYDIQGKRSTGETGVWIDPDIEGRQRKICAIGVRCSRWITMHGFAFNVNTDLHYFDYIIPCGIQNKQVTSMKKELGREIPLHEVKEKLQKNFKDVFQTEMIMDSF